MIDASAKQLADQFFEALRVHVAPAPAVAPELAPAPVLTAAAAPGEPAALPALPAPTVASRPAPAAAGLASEATRILWFLLGAAATGFGFWLAKALG